MTPVEIRGVIYANATDAAKALNVARGTIYTARWRGTTDTVGLGKRKPVTAEGLPAENPITIRGVTYASARKAATALGVSYRRIRHAKCSGTLETVGTRAKKCN